MVTHAKKFKKEEIINMRRFKIKRFISTVLVVMMLISMVSIIPVSANTGSNDAFYNQAAHLISENWSSDYFGTIVLEIDESTITVDGVKKELDPDSEAAPVVVDDSTMLPVKALINEIGAEISWDESAQKVIVERKANT